MLTTLNTLLAIRISTAANRFVYYVQKLPLIGRLLTDAFYSQLSLKRAVAVIVLILSLLWGFLSRLAYLGVLLYLPVIEFGKERFVEEQLQLFVHILFLISFIAAGVSSATILEPKREKYVAVKLMRLSPASYMHAFLSYRYSMFFIYLLPAMLIFTSLLGASIVQGVLLTISVTLWRIGCEYLHLIIFDKAGVVLIKKVVIVWASIALGYIAAYLPLVLQHTPISGAALLSLPTTLLVAAAGIFAALRLARYPDYRAVVDAATKRDDPLLDIGRMMSEAQKADVQTRESDYSPDRVPSERYGSKEGYAYLNAIFFARHRGMVNDPVYKRLAIIGVLGIIGVVAALLFKQHTAFLGSSLGAVLPYMVLTMNFFAVGERICRALFYNCDISLLRYSFYRSAAPEHFQIRLIKIISLNLLIAAALAAVMTVVHLAAGGSLLSLEVLMLWGCVLSLSVFFSVHHLFMYYIFQPYSTELNVKNPFYYFVTLAVSFASGISIIVRAPSILFTAVVFSLTLLYLGIALLLVRKHAHHTMRVK